MYIRVVPLPVLINVVCYMHGCVTHLHIHVYSHIDDLVILNHRLCFKLKFAGFHFVPYYKHHNSLY
jgi:hypothetical protein